MAQANQFPPQNKTDPRVLSFIDENPFCSIEEIIKNLDIPRRTAQRSLLRLISRNLIHVPDYDQRTSGAGKQKRLFLSGEGENAQSPKMTRKQRHRRRLSMQRKSRASESVKSRAREGGVFGVMIAQLIR